jgi:hypothetical protein
MGYCPAKGLKLSPVLSGGMWLLNDPFTKGVSPPNNASELRFVFRGIKMPFGKGRIHFQEFLDGSDALRAQLQFHGHLLLSYWGFSGSGIAPQFIVRTSANHLFN